MDDQRDQPATKKELLDRMLERGMAMIHLDARRDDVDVPPQFRDDPELRLNLSYRFQGGDLLVDGAGVRATLSFSGVPYTCIVPFEAIYAMVSHVSGESFFFPTDAPPEALAGLAAIVGPLQEAEEAARIQREDERPTAAGRRGAGTRPVLRAIDGGGEADATEPPAAPSPSPEPEADADADADVAENAEDGEAVSEASGEGRRRGHLRLVK